MSYLIKCNLKKQPYTVYGYKGKQVRDNIHSLDVVRFLEAFLESPRAGAVYNIGGGRENSVSILEAFTLIEEMTGAPMEYEYNAEARLGDHICYISDLKKITNDYPRWGITRNLHDIFQEIIDAWQRRPEQPSMCP